VLAVENLAVRYKNGALGIQDVSLQVARGSVVALLGPNGAGKTTTVRAITGFMKSEGAKVVRGSVRFEGTRIDGCEPHSAAGAGIAFVPERSKIFPNLTVSENLLVRGKQPPPARRQELFTEVWELFPMLAERRRTLAGRLSGGQQQMLAIAHAIISDPKLLVIDEMTLGLHPGLHEPLFDTISRLAERGTSLLVVDEATHFALQASQYTYVMVSGRVLREGPSADFTPDLVARSYVAAR
jgi:branched-chain amino acid transport system ATP-binding protein